MLYKKIFWFNQNNKTEQRKHIWNHWAIYICMLGLAVKEEPLSWFYKNNIPQPFKEKENSLSVF